MKNLLLITLLIFNVNSFAQIATPSVGSVYTNQTYYTLNDGSTKSNPLTDWDIAFDVSAQGAGILINEGAALGTSPSAELQLLYNGAVGFATADTTNMTRIFNDELAWTSGAFNSVASISDPFDLGWGTYSPGAGVSGSRVYFLKLRTGVYKKLEIQSLVGGAYTFRYADLDGSNEMTQAIDKANYSGKTLAYFSIENDVALDLEPTSWDLLFTRYYGDIGGGVNYPVTGVLHNNGIQVAQVDNIDPITVDYTNYTNAYSDIISVIGSDWKDFDFQTGWVIKSDQVFFVKTASDSIWKVQFLDFEGSSTGVTTLEKTFETVLVSTNAVYQSVESFNVYPNPVVDYVNIAFELDTDNCAATLEIYNTLGQNVLSQNIPVDNGFNLKRLPIDLVSGTYYLSLRIGNEVITQPIFIK
jgi:hypothetical protein